MKQRGAAEQGLDAQQLINAHYSTNKGYYSSSAMSVSPRRGHVTAEHPRAAHFPNNCGPVQINFECYPGSTGTPCCSSLSGLERGRKALEYQVAWTVSEPLSPTLPIARPARPDSIKRGATGQHGGLDTG